MARLDVDGRNGDLFAQITAFPHLLQALRRAASGKRSKPGVAAFLSRQEKALIRLRDQLQSGEWRGGGYTVIEVRDPKPRRISAAPFADRVVHHALCSVIAPVFERGFIADSYANRTGYGQHRAVARYEHYRDRYRYVLRCDIYRYFPSIDHAILKRDYRRRIGCPRTLALLDTIVDGSNPQEPVNLLFPGDDLLTQAERKRGLPLGNLTSQWFGNLYLDGFDHYVKEVLRAPYLRFVDDFALFANDAATLASTNRTLPRRAQTAAAPAQDIHRAHRRTGAISRLRAAPGRHAHAAARQRQPFPGAAAIAARPLAQRRTE